MYPPKGDLHLNDLFHSHPNRALDTLNLTQPERNALAETLLTGQDLTPTQRAAFDLYSMGLNVFPQFYGQKQGVPWKALQSTRVEFNSLFHLFAGQVNLAVMVGKTSRNLFVLDCETEETFAFSINQMQKRHIPIWAVQTARGGHLWLFSADGEVHNIRAGTIAGVEVRGSNCYVLCPPSLHPSGVFYHWSLGESAAPPAVSLAQINWFTDTAGYPITLKANRRRTSTPSSQARLRVEHLASRLKLPVDGRLLKLSNRTLDYLETGDSIPEGTRNNRLYQAARDLNGCGFNQHEADHLLTPLAQTSGLSSQEIALTLTSAYSRPATPSRPQTPNSFSPRPQTWLHALAYIQSKRWTGRTGSTDYRVALALVERAKMGSDSHGVFRASERELATMARVGSRNTARKSLKRLQSDDDPPLLVRIGGQDRSGANRWRFSDEMLQLGKGKVVNDPLLLHQGCDTSSGSILHQPWLPTTDAAERGALGPAGVRLYETLKQLGGVVRTRDLIRTSKLSPSQVAAGLRKLKQYGLAASSDRGWWYAKRVVNIQELDDLVATQAGTRGKGQARQQGFAEERAHRATSVLLQVRRQHRSMV
jgi:hypothetical protein